MTAHVRLLINKSFAELAARYSFSPKVIYHKSKDTLAHNIQSNYQFAAFETAA